MGMMATVRPRFAALVGLAGLALLTAAPARALEIQDLRSPGGAVFWLVEEPSIPIVALEISFAGGARLDPEGRAGLANMMAGLIEEGAGDLDAVGFAKARDDLSARFGFSAGRDTMEVSARMLVETLEPSVALLATALASPRFDPEPVGRVRAQILSIIAESGTEPGTVAAEAWYAGAFPDHPYGRPTDGTAESVAAITRDDLVAARARLLTRANARIAVVGAIDAEQAGRMVDTVLAGLESVDWVVQCCEDTPQRLIRNIMPDVLTKGGDYKPDDIVGASDVMAAGGEVRVLPFREGQSTSSIIDKLKS